MKFLHIVRVEIVSGQGREALQSIEEMGRLVEMSALGMTDEIDNEVVRTRATFDDLSTLRNDKAFDDELRKLYGESE